MARPNIRGSLVERLKQIAVADIFYDPSFEYEETEEKAWAKQVSIAIETIEEAATKLAKLEGKTK